MAALSLASSASPPPPSASLAMPASAPTKSSTPIPIAQNAAGRKKRGVDHKCESCSKIYRHPSCLIKHRWEHTPHWRMLSSLPHSASGGVLSKHAQVQLLEAAAILSHLSPDSETGTSLPEDRSMWPRWVNGGILEGEQEAAASFGDETEHVAGSVVEQTTTALFGSQPVPVPVFGSVPTTGSAHYAVHHAHARGGAAAGSGPGSGPRLHDYEVPRGGAEVRAGVVEVPHPHAGTARGGRVNGHHHHHTNSLGSVGGAAWNVPRSVSVSASVSSEQSRSRSTPSDDEELEGEGGEDEDNMDDDDSVGERGRGRGRGRGGARVWKHEEEEEFGFDLDLGGVREEEDDEEAEAEKARRRRQLGGPGESLRWGGIAEEMDDIDMDMD